MAKVSIVIKDKGKGKLAISVHSHPPFPGPTAKNQPLTKAQQAVMMMLAWLNEREQAEAAARQIEQQARAEVTAKPEIERKL